MCQLFASCFVRRTTRISTNQSDNDWHHALDSCALEVFRMSPKRAFAYFYLALFHKNYTFSQAIRTSPSSQSLSHHDHAQNRSANCYSLRVGLKSWPSDNSSVLTPTKNIQPQGKHNYFRGGTPLVVTPRVLFHRAAKQKKNCLQINICLADYVGYQASFHTKYMHFSW